MKMPIYAITTALILVSQNVIAEINIENAWVRLVPSVSRVTAGYVTFKNVGPNYDELIKVETNATQSSSLHKTDHAGKSTGMRAIKSIVLPANGSVELKPGGLHIMMRGLDHSKFDQQEVITATFHFLESPPQTIEMIIKSSHEEVTHKHH